MQNKHTLDVSKGEEMVPKSNQNISSDFRELSSNSKLSLPYVVFFYYLYFISKLTATVSISKMYNWLLPLFHFDVQLMQNVHAGVLHASKLSRDDGALLLIKSHLKFVNTQDVLITHYVYDKSYNVTLSMKQKVLLRWRPNIPVGSLSPSSGAAGTLYQIPNKKNSPHTKTHAHKHLIPLTNI